MSNSITSTTTGPDVVDVRGPRFAAWVTTAVLVAALLVAAADPPAAAVILSVQAVIFAIGAIGGPRRHPYGRIFAGLVAPRLGPVLEREPVAPLKFAQLVGLVFAVAAAAGFATGAFLVGVVATAAALVAAFLNAAFGICLGCQLYPLVARMRRAPRPARPPAGVEARAEANGSAMAASTPRDDGNAPRATAVGRQIRHPSGRHDRVGNVR